MADSLHVASFCCFSFPLSFPLSQEVCTEDGALSKLSDISDFLRQGLTVQSWPWPEGRLASALQVRGLKAGASVEWANE